MAMTGKIIRTMLAILIAGSVIGAAIAPINAEEAIKETTDIIEEIGLDGQFSEIATQGNLTFFCDLETGRFYLKNIDGSIWYSTPANIEEIEGMKGSEKSKVYSNLLLTLIDSEFKNEKIYVTTEGDCLYYDGLTAKNIKNGVELSYYFSDYELTVPLTLQLNENGFSASVDVGKIKEGKRYRLTHISILPYFNAGHLTEQGYLFVPDGSGALIHFNNEKKSLQKYEQKVYSYDYSISRNSNNVKEQEIRLPVFGVNRSGGFSLGIITEGTSSAKIIASTNNHLNQYNCVYAEFVLRLSDLYRYTNDVKSDVDIYQNTKLPQRTLELTYRLASQKNETYTHMAKNYRDYLMTKIGLTQQKDEKTAFYLDLYGATVRKKPLLGIPVNRKEVLTTFDQAGEILDLLYDSGVRNLVVRYKKWSDTTIWGKMSKSSTPSAALGGKSDFKKLKEKIAGYGYRLYLDGNPVNIKKGNNLLSFFTDYAHNMRNYTIELYPFKLSTQMENTSSKSFLVRQSSLLAQFRGLDKSIAAQSPDGISISGAQMLYTDFRKKDSHQDETRLSMVKALDSITENKSIMVESGNDYMLPYADHVMNAPGTWSAFDMEDESVPFYQIAVHGLVDYSIVSINSHPDYTNAFLRSVEIGAMPCFEWFYQSADRLSGADDEGLYYANYKSWITLAAEMYQKSSAFYSAVSASAIVDHTRLSDGVYHTAYENGVYTVVNYNLQSVDTPYGSVEAKSFICGGM